MTMFENKAKHNWLIVSLIFANLLIYVAMVGFNIIASFPSPANANKTLFPKDVGGISDYIYLDIIPAGWVFSTIWTIIFVWNLIWLFYAVICIFRRTDDGSLLYRKFDFFHFGIFISFIVNNIAIIIWLFLWTNLFTGWAFMLIVITLIPLDVCLFILMRKIKQNKHALLEHKLKADLVLLRILPQNGLAFFATWLTLATNLNFAQFLTYECGANQEVASTIVLFIILSIVVTYFVIENIVWPRYMLYMFTPWFVVNFALIGSLAKNWKTASPTRNNVITVILFVITMSLAIAKIVMFILYKTVLKNRLHRRIIHKNLVESTTDVKNI